MTIEQINRYKILKKIGSGGMGEVYLAFDPMLERNVAIKVMHKHLLENNKHDERFLREARVAARLLHPNIVTIYEIGESEYGRYIVMEYVEGTPLSKIIAARNRIGVADASGIIKGILQGISAAHKTAIFHRDIKPDNILVNDDGWVKILDFGIAKTITNQQLTVAGDVLGTVEYMPPEQMLGETIDQTSDTYAAASVYYQMLTNRLPFRGKTPVETLFKKINEEPVPINLINEEVSGELNQIILKAIKPNRFERWESAEAFLKAIEKCTQPQPGNISVNNEIDESRYDLEQAKEFDTTEFLAIKPVFIGRENEYRQLVHLYNRVKAGEGQTLMIMGEAGVGKSTLASQLMNYVTHENAWILNGECLYQEGLDAYLPYIDALRKFFNKESYELPVEKRENLKRIIREKVPLLMEFTHHFDTMVSAGIESELVTHTLKGGNLLEGIYLIISYLSSIKPIVLVIDDIQWADESSLRLFHYFSRNISGHPVLLMGVCRTDRYDLQKDGRPTLIVDILSRMRRDHTLNEITLNRFDREDCAKLIDKSLTKTFFSDDFYHRIYRETKGNPFFVLETLKLLQDTGAIYLKNDIWYDQQDGFKIEVPHRVEDVFVRRLSALSEDEREMLQVSAILGYKFDVSLLARVLEISKIKLLKTLQKVERDLQIITSTEEGFQFEHPMLQDLLRDEIPQVLRKEYHLMAAEEMTKIYGDNLGSKTGELALHYRRANENKKAIPLLYKAALRAFKISAYREACVFFEELIEAGKKGENLLPDDISISDIYLKIGISYEEIGRWKQSLKTFKKLLSISINTENIRTKVDALRRIGRVYDKQGKWEKALEHYQNCLEILDEHPIKNERSRIYNNIGVIYFQQGNYDTALTFFQKTLKSVDSEYGKFDCAHALTNMGSVLNIQGKHTQALQNYREALGYYQELNNQKGIARIYHNIGMTQTELGEPEEAIMAFEESFQIADEIEDNQLRAMNYLNMGRVFAQQGKLKLALKNATRALKIFKRMTDILGVAEAYHVLGLALSEKRDFKHAEKYFKLSIEINLEKNYQDGLGENYVAYGNLLRDHNFYDQAGDYYKRAIEIYQKLELQEKIDELIASLDELNLHEVRSSDTAEMENPAYLHALPHP